MQAERAPCLETKSKSFGLHWQGRGVLVDVFNRGLNRVRSLCTASRPKVSPPAMRALPSAVQRVAESVRSPESWSVDDQTWHDLDLDAFVRRATAASSLLGQHRLYGLLRHGDSPVALRDVRCQLAALLARPDVETLLQTQVFKPLHELDFDPSAALFCDPPLNVPAWTRYLRHFVPTVVLSSGALLITGWALVVIAALVLVSGMVQIRLYATLSIWQRTRRSLLMMLAAAQSLQALGEVLNGVHPGLADSGEVKTQDLVRQLKPSFWHQFPNLAEQLNLFTLSEYTELLEQLPRFEETLRAPLRLLHERLATLEAVLCMAAQLRGADRHCRATISPAHRGLRFEQLSNPLVPGMEPTEALQVDDGGLLLTGQNGVGKSTLLRAVGLNLVVARSFGHCFAAVADVCEAEVASSISVVDSTQQGLSLYMAQVRCVVDMLERSRRARSLVVLLDEILGGSNYLDSMCASAAVLHELAQRATVLVSTHHVLLAPLLRDVLRPVRLERCPGGRVQLTDGVLLETNGQAMLSHLGMPALVTATAAALSAWLSTYLIDPPNCPQVSAFSSAPGVKV